jgi:hypothetical protein
VSWVVGRRIVPNGQADSSRDASKQRTDAGPRFARPGGRFLGRGQPGEIDRDVRIWLAVQHERVRAHGAIAAEVVTGQTAVEAVVIGDGLQELRPGYENSAEQLDHRRQRDGIRLI